MLKLSCQAFTNSWFKYYCRIFFKAIKLHMFPEIKGNKHIFLFFILLNGSITLHIFCIKPRLPFMPLMPPLLYYIIIL